MEINVYLRNVTPKDALDSIAKANGLYYKSDEQSGIVRISTTKEYRKPLENLSPDEIFAIEQARQTGSTDPEALAGIMEKYRATIFVSVIRRNNQLIVRTGDEQIMQQIRELVARLDVPTPLVLLDKKFLQALDHVEDDHDTLCGIAGRGARERGLVRLGGAYGRTRQRGPRSTMRMERTTTNWTPRCAIHRGRCAPHGENRKTSYCPSRFSTGNAFACSV